ncbi:MAG: hypothetical protein E6J90_33525 [Deltaproteobacteria bacterium]|nr:MAG: hypothetical protein E6J90_33525 [Deltaproteobacteria bacterium]TMQ14220.1 MAG: hypothetical protein E6J91_16170 [Deltaproteobacteria bacterium]
MREADLHQAARHAAAAMCGMHDGAAELVDRKSPGIERRDLPHDVVRRERRQRTAPRPQRLIGEIGIAEAGDDASDQALVLGLRLGHDQTQRADHRVRHRIECPEGNR